MSRSARFTCLRRLGFVVTLGLPGLIAGCGSNVGHGTFDGPTWSLADKKPPAAVEQSSDRAALGAKAASSQPITPPITPATTIIVVAKGDTLHGLALQHRTTVKALMAANNLASHTVRLGQKLQVPNSQTKVAQ